ncbi:M48 family metallopeptidase [Hymenobacter pini]|uniref:M48 family metallopeptidase n=1 Tax=Hymenobacter pini TaxID=2880879 RepID=UPI001CF4AB2A|nr:SprT family zinc-dependent metalloprotease [Hymenobacter pini]MCA8831913.1 M48 family metallopeptidase [Hymenobacter pini]
MSADVHQVSYGTRELSFSLSYSPRRRTVGITVRPAGCISVVAPTATPLEQVRAAVLRRASWLVRQLQFFASVPAPVAPREYVAGETHRYLGRQYRLRIVSLVEESASQAGKPAEPEGVRLRGAYLHVYTRRPQAPDHTRRLLERWYADHARRRLAERYAHCAGQVRRYGIQAPEWQLRTMPTRWGSYTRAGRILLNPRLIQAPTACVDYLILHELCHVAHPDHGPGFYQLLTRLLPNWPALRERLNHYS